jgi:hypothetical protein
VLRGEEFRLETLAAYDVEEEKQELERFLAGGPLSPEWSDSPWVRGITSRGKSMARVAAMTMSV